VLFRSSVNNFAPKYEKIKKPKGKKLKGVNNKIVLKPNKNNDKDCLFTAKVA
jgi:hypothetical protein